MNLIFYFIYIFIYLSIISLIKCLNNPFQKIKNIFQI